MHLISGVARRHELTAGTHIGERLLTPGEVAALFRVDPKTVTRWATAGRIGSIRTPGGHRRFRESEVKALLAELTTEAAVARTFVDRCITEHNAGRLAIQDAAMAKWWTTELQNKVADRCLQLHGGYGYMLEYAIARAFLDSRVQTIYGGSTEIMKEIIGRSLGL